MAAAPGVGVSLRRREGGGRRIGASRPMPGRRPCRRGHAPRSSGRSRPDSLPAHQGTGVVVAISLRLPPRRPFGIRHEPVPCRLPRPAAPAPPWWHPIERVLTRAGHSSPAAAISRRAGDRSPRWASWGAVALVVVPVAVNVAWVARPLGGRAGRPDGSPGTLDLAFHASGPGTARSPRPTCCGASPAFQAPLLPGPDPPSALAGWAHPGGELPVPSVVLAALVAATYLPGCRPTTTAGWALLGGGGDRHLPGDQSTTAGTTTSPPAATTTFTAGLLTLVRTRRFTHRGWSSVWAPGPLVLSRTIMLASPLASGVT